MYQGTADRRYLSKDFFCLNNWEEFMHSRNLAWWTLKHSYNANIKERTLEEQLYASSPLSFPYSQD